ncbi:hypothetical protein D9M72_275920 [compost metagenome]
MALRTLAAHGCLVVDDPATRALDLQLGEACGLGEQSPAAATTNLDHASLNCIYEQ